MAKVSLGVVDLAYASTDDPEATTTGKVAEILEKKYEVMGVFVKNHEPEIADSVMRAVMHVAKELLDSQSSPALQNAYGMQLPKVESAFRDYLGRDEWQKTTGKIIKAAKAGVNHRLKHPYAKANLARPAFIDTGLYSRSFRAYLNLS